jgi:hypothetical protein
MAGKLGEGRLERQIDLGFREAGGFFYHDSNIAQPMYPLRGNYAPPKEIDSIGPDKPEPSFEELHPVGPGLDDRGRADRDRGMELE